MSLLLLLSAPPSSLATDPVAFAQRLVVHTTGTIDLYITQDGEPVDPDDDIASVYINRDDGTQLVAPVNAQHIALGHFQFALTADINTQLDLLSVHWTVVVGGEQHVLHTGVEIVGGYLFGLADARSDPDLADTTRFTTRMIENARTYAEQELERAIGYAFVPRYTRAPVHYPDTFVTLRPYLRTVRSVNRGGVSVADPAAFTWDTVGTVNLNGLISAPTAGSTSIDIAYEHGMDGPPAAVSQAALILAKEYLTDKPMDDRAIQRITEDGPIFIATPGFNGARFGLPSVDAVITAYRMPTVA